MAKEKSTLEQSVGDVKQAYSARVDAPNQFVPKQSARVARVDSISRDVNALLGIGSQVVQDRNRLTGEAVKRHAMDMKSQQAVAYMGMDAELSPTDDRHGAMSNASALLSEGVGANTYDDPDKQAIFDQYYTRPATEHLSRQYNKWSSEQHVLDQRQVVDQQNTELEIGAQPSNLTPPQDKYNHRMEIRAQAVKQGQPMEAWDLRTATTYTKTWERDYDKEPDAFIARVVNRNGDIDHNALATIWDRYYGSYGSYNPETKTMQWEYTDDPEVQSKLMKSFTGFLTSADAAVKTNKASQIARGKAFVDSFYHTGVVQQSDATLDGETTYTMALETDKEVRDKKMNKGLALLGFTQDSENLEAIRIYKQNKDTEAKPSDVEFFRVSNIAIGQDAHTSGLNADDQKTASNNRAQMVMAEMAAVQLEIEKAKKDNPGASIPDALMKRVVGLQVETQGNMNGQSNTIITEAIAKSALETQGTMQGYNLWKKNRVLIDSPNFGNYLNGSNLDKKDQRMLQRLYSEYETYDMELRNNLNPEPLKFDQDKLDSLERSAAGYWDKKDAAAINAGSTAKMEMRKNFSWMPKNDLDLMIDDLDHSLTVETGTSSKKNPGSVVSSRYVDTYKSPTGSPFRYRLNENAIAKGGDNLERKMASTVTKEGEEPELQYANNLSSHIYTYAAKSKQVDDNILQNMAEYGYTITPVMIAGVQQKGANRDSSSPGVYELHYNDANNITHRVGFKIDLSVWDGTINKEDKEYLPAGMRKSRLIGITRDVGF